MAVYQYEVDQIGKRDWHELLLAFTDASIDQSRSYSEARWQKATVSNLLVKCDKDIVAAAQVIIRYVPFLRSGVAHVKFGPLWQSFNQPANPEHLKQVIYFLHQEYVVKRGLYLRLMPPPLKDSVDLYCNTLHYAGFKQANIIDCDRYIVNLSAPVEELRKNLKGRWRNHLNRAERQNLQCQQLDGEDAVTIFMSLYDNMVKRKKFIDTSAITEFPLFHSDLEPALRPKIFICYANNVPVAGAVISALGDTAQYLFGATNSTGLELDAGYFVQWEVVKYLVNLPIAWYDLGGAVNNAGLHQFKSGLIGKNGVKALLPGEFDCCENPMSRIVATLGFKLKTLGISV